MVHTGAFTNICLPLTSTATNPANLTLSSPCALLLFASLLEPSVAVFLAPLFPSFFLNFPPSAPGFSASLSSFSPLPVLLSSAASSCGLSSGGMPPPQGNQGQGESRDGREGPPPNYSRQGFPGGQGQQPPTPGLNNPSNNSANYRGGPPQRESSQVAGGGEQGRSTPPPVATGERTVEDNYKELCMSLHYHSCQTVLICIQW